MPAGLVVIPLALGGKTGREIQTYGQQSPSMDESDGGPRG